MATVPTPTTQIAGAQVNAATINSQGNLATYLAGRTESGGARRPFFQGRQSVLQSIPNSTDTAITFDLEDVDHDNGHSTVSNTDRYTAQTAGWYAFGAQVSIASNSTGVRQFFFNINGANSTSGALSIAPVTGGITVVQFRMWVSLSVNDFVQVMANQNSGGALNTVVTSPFQSSMRAEWISV